MPFDGIAVAALTSELNELLADGRIEKINQPERDELLLLIRAHGVNRRLVLSASASSPRAHLQTTTKENPEKAPMFCMLLRKHFQGAKIIGFSQPSMERVLVMETEGRNEMGDISRKRLITELMGKHSNIIAVDENDCVLGSIKHVDFTVSSVRQVLPGMKYELPPDQGKRDPRTVTTEEIVAVLRSAAEPADRCLLDAFCGLSPLAAREIAHLGLGEADYDLTRATDVTILRFAHFVKKFFERYLSPPFTPVVLYHPNGRIADFSALPVTQYGDAMRSEPSPSLSEAAETLYETRDRQERLAQRTGDLIRLVETNLARCRKKEALQRNKLKDCEKKELYRIRGDILMANLYRVPQEDSVTLENFYDDNNPIKIPLQTDLTPAQNAQRYYTLFRKAKTAEEVTTEQLTATLAEQEYLESVLNHILDASTLPEAAALREELAQEGYLVRREQPGNKKRKEAPLEPISETFGGYEILIGRNNLQNDQLTLRLANNSDIWLHTKDFPSAHVILRTKGTTPPDEVVLYAAELCAAHSRAKQSDNVPVDYTEVRNVKKPRGAKAGMVIYDHYRTVYVTPRV